MVTAEDLKGLKLKDIHKAVLDIDKERAFHMKALGIVLRLLEIEKTTVQSEAELCEHISRVLIEETDFSNVSIFLYNPDEDCLELKASVKREGKTVPLNGTDMIDKKFSRNEGLIWSVFDSHEPKFVEDVHDLDVPLLLVEHHKPVSLICLPIRNGVVCLSTARKRNFPNYIKRNFIIISDVISHIFHTHEPDELLAQGHYQIQNLVSSSHWTINDPGEAESIIDYLMVTMEESPQGICILDSKGNIIKVNKVLCNKLQSEPSVIKEQGISKFFFDASAYLSLAKAIKENRFKKLQQIRLIKPDGNTFLADIFYHPVNERKGEKKGGIIFIHDLSDQLKDSEQKVREEKLKALGSMAAGVAHDFNNLLMAILGNVELLLIELKDTAYEKRLRNIEICVNDGAQTIQRIQTFVKSKKKSHIAQKAIYVSEVIKEAIQFTKPLWKDDCQKRGIYIDIDTELTEKLAANIPEYELREVMVNLLVNAIEAMPRGGKIIIKTYKEDGKAIIEMRDTGIGMDEETLPHIFDPYFSTKESGSSGLGLSIVYGLITNVGGEIEVSSQKGLGTIFKIVLPSSAEVANLENRAKDITPLQGSRYNILVVDDEPQIAELMKEMLENLGHRVLISTDPKDAMEKLKAESFDLVLTDLGMPQISGWDLAAYAKKQNANTKVTLMTGWGATYKDEDLRSKGIDALLSKPFKLKDLTGLFTRLFPETRASAA